MDPLNDKEMEIIRTKVTTNSAVKPDTLVNKIGQELYDTCLNNHLIEINSGKAKFSSDFWVSVKPKKPPANKATVAKAASKSTYKIADAEKDIIELKEEIKNIKQQLTVFTSFIEKIDGSSINKVPNKKMSSEEFKKELKTSYDTINFNERRGGMIPIPKLWDELSKKGVERTQFEDELFKLEKEQIIELQIANDPKLVSDQKKSIQHPSRGLINYVVWRR